MRAFEEVYNRLASANVRASKYSKSTGPIGSSEITLLRVCSEECCSKGRGNLGGRAGVFWGDAVAREEAKLGRWSLGRGTRQWRYLGLASQVSVAQEMRELPCQSAREQGPGSGQSSRTGQSGALSTTASQERAPPRAMGGFMLPVQITAVHYCSEAPQEQRRGEALRGRVATSKSNHGRRLLS